MTYRFTPITESEAREVLSWHYPDIATLYNPDPAEFEADVWELLAPEYHYHAVRDDDRLVGFCCFGEDAQVPDGDYSLPALDVGCGLNPALTGQGLSSEFFAAVLGHGRERFQPTHFRATVATINVRSMRMVLRAGFCEVQRFISGDEPLEFALFVRDA